jgi:hypothetical protein
VLSSQLHTPPEVAKHLLYCTGAAEKRPLIKERSLVKVLYLHHYKNVILKYTRKFTALNTSLV